MKVWIEAMRLRTLPLSAAGVIIAGGLAAHWDSFRPEIFIPMLAMVLALQILANFADEYGDLEKGTDNENRVGPVRGMQRGEISRATMKRAMVLDCVVIVILIELLLFMSFGLAGWRGITAFTALGALAITAAIKYTVGRHAYGYFGLGDIVSFLFFGLIAVSCGFFLYTHRMIGIVFLPAVGLGCLVVGVLNLNNMRDLENDRACGKTTMVVLLGARGALAYHAVLIALGIVGFLSFSLASGVTDWWRYIYVLFFIPLIVQLAGVMKCDDPSHYDRFMKPLSMTTAFLSLVFALCIGL